MPRTFNFGRTALAVSALAAALLLVSLAGRSRAAEPAPEATAAVDIGLMGLATLPDSITSITSAGDSRVFLTLQGGQIRVFSGGIILPTPFLDLSGIVSCCGEQGLLSVAFHPSYASNGLFFVYYTEGPAPGNSGDRIVIARYVNPTPSGNVADLSSGVQLLTIDHPVNLNHNGGQLQFGPMDGFLYFGTGDGGSGDDPPCNAQNDNVALGKLLRIDVDHDADASHHYSVPASNPHYVAPGNPDDPFQLTWAKGLRNPFRFSFDRSTHDLWIGDVGQNQWEEIDHQLASSTGGENYGWRIYEGNQCRSGMIAGCSPTPPGCGSPAYTSPVFVYDHSGSRCAILGGYVYRGSQIPGLVGTYVYGDLCSGDLYGFSGGSSTHFTPNKIGLQTFGQDSSGELYLGDGGGGFYRIIAAAATPTPTPTRTFTRTPTPTASPTPTEDPSARRTPVPARERRPPTRELTPRPSD
jgi:glucose/arabinose dehydrogenase